MDSVTTSRSRRRSLIAAASVILLVGALAGAYEMASASTPSSTATMFVPLPPARILDTRSGIGAGGATLPLAGGNVLSLQVTGAGGVPADAVAVQLNVTVTQGTAPAFLTIWPTGSTRPEASVLNIVPGQDTPNMITAQLGTNGQLSLFTNTGTVHVLADVAGYFVPGTTITGAVGEPTPPSEVPAEARWTVMWPIAAGVGHMAVREDGSIRDQSNAADTVTKVDTGQYCIKATGATEGAVGSIQVGGPFASIKVSMGVGSFCNSVVGANITVEVTQLG